MEKMEETLQVRFHFPCQCTAQAPPYSLDIQAWHRFSIRHLLQGRHEAGAMPCKGPFLDSAKRGVSAETKKFQAFKKDLPHKTASEKSRFICTQSKGDIFHHRLRKPKKKNKSQFPSFPSPCFASRKEVKREGGTKQGKSKKTF